MSSGKTPSQRQRRVGELVRKALSDLFARGEIHDPELAQVVITVPQVRMSPDLKLAVAYVMPLGGEHGAEIVDALKRNRKYLRGQLSHDLDLKYMPDLRFELDGTFDAAGRLDALLRSPRVVRDLDDST